MKSRENSEWSRFWWEEANNRGGRRVLLVGDSITEGYRKNVQEILRGKYLVDMMATSKSIADPCYMKELNYVLSEYPYEQIHFNNGLHDLDLSDSDYAVGYEYAVRCMSYTDSRIILTATTPVIIQNEPDKLDQELSAIVLHRNKIVMELCEKYSCMYHDLYTAMYGKTEFRLGDRFHYNEEGKKYQAVLVSNILQSSDK